MKQLFLVSIIEPFFIRPIKLFIAFVLCFLFIKKWSYFFDFVENCSVYNRVSLSKTLYFNFRSLPYKIAIKVPIHIFANTQIISSTGKINIIGADITPGMIRWGWFHGFRSQGVTRINNHGTIIFRGGGKIFSGSEIMVRERATLEIDSNFFIGENSSIYCWDHITIGKSVCVTYHCQLFDSDFHYSINTITGEVKRRCQPIVIGDYNWIGNKATIKKGTKTPNHLVVAASNSLLTGQRLFRNVSAILHCRWQSYKVTR